MFVLGLKLTAQNIQERNAFNVDLISTAQSFRKEGRKEGHSCNGKEISVAGRKFLSQEGNSCHRKEIPVTGRQFCHRREIS